MMLHDSLSAGVSDLGWSMLAENSCHCVVATNEVCTSLNDCNLSLVGVVVPKVLPSLLSLRFVKYCVDTSEAVAAMTLDDIRYMVIETCGVDAVDRSWESHWAPTWTCYVDGRGWHRDTFHRYYMIGKSMDRDKHDESFHQIDFVVVLEYKPKGAHDKMVMVLLLGLL